MKSLHHLSPPSSLIVLASHLPFLPLVASISHNDNVAKTHNIPREDIHKMNVKTKSDIAIHGILFWVSMGFLLPMGILAIRMHHKYKGGFRKALFYVHVVFQLLALMLATAGAIMSIRSFENSFNNSHQRIGLALYGAIWVQAGTGFMRPSRGNKRRSSWYFLHWIVGTVVSLFGIFNIYTGLEAYHKKTHTSTRTWAVLFTSQLTLMAFFYLLQDKWDYLRSQGSAATVRSTDGEDVVGPTSHNISTVDHNQVADDPTELGRRKVLVLAPEPCPKRNALKNLFAD